MPISGRIPPAVIKKLVEEALEELQVLLSNPPSAEEKAVDNVFVVEVEGSPRLEVEYEDEG